MAALAGDLTKALLGQTDAAKAFRYTLVQCFIEIFPVIHVCMPRCAVRYQILRNMLVITLNFDTGGKWKKSSIRKILTILFGHLWVVEETYI